VRLARVLLAITFAAAVAACGAVEERPPQGRLAPELEGEWIVGEPVRLADLRGKPVLVNIWASSCGACWAEAPALAAFEDELRGRAHLVGIVYRDPREDARAFAEQFHLRFPSVADPQGTLAAQYGVPGLPVTYVLDADGRIVETLVGPQSFGELVAAVERASD
jgi:peroxiredoxin